MSDIRIRSLKDGPYEVHGSVTLVGADGREEQTTEDIYLCRCGQSQNKPFCDGTHKKTGFQAPGWTRPSSRG